jgi:hypothetical protein
MATSKSTPSTLITEDFNPIADAPVIEKGNRPTYVVAPETASSVEDADTFTPPPFTDEPIGQTDNNAGNDYANTDYSQQTNVPLEDVDEKSPDQLAEVAIGVYEYLMSLAPKIVMFNEKKLNDMHRKGEIDLKIPVPYDADGNVIPVDQYVQKFNASAKEAGIVSDDFKQKVTPILIRIFRKKGLGLTDEQTLMILIGQDVIQRGVMLFQLKVQGNSIIAHLKELKEEMKKAPEKQPQPEKPVTPPYRGEPEEQPYQPAKETVKKATKTNVVVVQKGKRGRKPKNTNVEDVQQIVETQEEQM